MSAASGRSAGPPEAPGRLDPPPRRIAVLRANGLGDLMFSLPALDALRTAYPEAEIVLLAKAWHRDLFAGRPGPVDRVVEIPPVLDGQDEGAVGETQAEETRRFFATMAAERFDLAVQLHGGGRHSNPFVRRLRAGLTVGLQAPDAAPLDRCVPYVYYQSEVLRLLEVVASVGAPLVGVEPRLAVVPGDFHAAAQVLAPDSRPLAVLHPGATDGRRRWPPTRFAKVAERLAGAGARVAVVGTGDEQELAAAVVAAAGAPVVDLAGRLSLGALVGLLAVSTVVVANDSGPLHLGAAVGAATVGIYWCGNLINAGPMTRARHRPALSWRLRCPDCGLDCTRSTCGHRSSFVTDVSVDEVAEPALELLEGARSAVPGVGDLVADAPHPAGGRGDVDDEVVGIGGEASP